MNTSAGTPVLQNPSLRIYAVLVVAVLALVAGVFAAYSFTDRSPVATLAPASDTVEGTTGGATSGCTDRVHIGGGFVEGAGIADGCEPTSARLPNGLVP